METPYPVILRYEELAILDVKYLVARSHYNESEGLYVKTWKTLEKTVCNKADFFAQIRAWEIVPILNE